MQILRFDFIISLFIISYEFIQVGTYLRTNCVMLQSEAQPPVMHPSWEIWL